MNLVIGASGLVGSNLYRVLNERGAAVRGTYLSHPSPGLEPLDLTDESAVERLLADARPSVVYLPAANPFVDWIEENPEASRRINVDAPKRLVDRLRGSAARLVYYSTDYVFDGTAGPYSEEDAPNPLSEYGRQKLEVEEYVRGALPDALVLRVAVVYGWERNPKNFAHRLVNNLRAGNTQMRLPSDQYGNPSYAPNLAAASVELAESGAGGLFHLCGEAVANRYEFAAAVADTFGLPKDGMEPVTTDRLSQKAKRPLNAGMVVGKAQSRLRTPLLGYPAALKLMKEGETHPHG